MKKNTYIVFATALTLFAATNAFGMKRRREYTPEQEPLAKRRKIGAVVVRNVPANGFAECVENLQGTFLSVKKLSVLNSPNLTNNDIDYIIDNFPNLVELELDFGRTTATRRDYPSLNRTEELRLESFTLRGLRNYLLSIEVRNFIAQLKNIGQ